MTVITPGGLQRLLVARFSQPGSQILVTLKDSEDLAELGTSGLKQSQAVRPGSGVRVFVTHHAARPVGFAGYLSYQSPAGIGGIPKAEFLFPHEQCRRFKDLQNAGEQPLVEQPRRLLIAVTARRGLP